jgi:hypothetical protein
LDELLGSADAASDPRLYDENQQHKREAKGEQPEQHVPVAGTPLPLE